MSLTTAQRLLYEYNKNNPYVKTESIDSKADQSVRRFGTWSYANEYDALYDRYSQNKNFNLNMWRDAINLGEQDQYFAFLEQNKDNTLSNAFYDPQYYDYETMMLEMYLPFADSTNKKEQFVDEYNQATGEWEAKSLGLMSDRDYFQYQLNQNRELKAAEIKTQLEQERKEQLGWWGQFGNDVLATLYEFGEGLLSGLTGIVDFVAAVGTGGLVPYATNGFEGNYLDAFVDYFGKNGLTAAEKNTIRAALDEYERTHTHFRDLDGNITGVGKYIAGISNSIGMMVPAIVTNAFTGGTASLAWMGSATFYTSIFTNNMYETATNPYTMNSPSWVKITNAAVKTGAEAVIEWGLGKMLGSTIQNQMIGISGKRNLGEGILQNILQGHGFGYLFKSAAQEGLEEFLQDFGTNCVDQFTDLIYEGYGNTGVTMQTLIDSFIIGAVTSILMSGGRVALSETQAALRNRKEAGSGDLVIETKDGIQKLTGLKRLQYSQILSDFQDAIDELKNTKINDAKSLKLAQEVYGALSVISQFYSGFDTQRIKNCEMLLDRIAKAEQSNTTENDISIKNTFAQTVETTFRSMVGELNIKHAAKLRAATEKVQDKLDKGGATEAKMFINVDGERFTKDPEMAELEKRLGPKAADNLDELRKGYEWVITVDGHIACESDGYLFVSEAWLQNYKITDIYKYLEQTRILETLASDKMLAPMVKKLIAFDKEFTGQTDVDAERALMDLLFNKSVYQAFLLSNAGKNMHEFKSFIFQPHEIIKDLGQRSKYHQQLFKGKQAQARINMLNQIYEQIKETMREPTIKAILNWHIDPQVVGADSVLTERDRETIAKYQGRKRTLNGTGTSRSAYENLVEDIIRSGKLSTEALDVIKKSLDGIATLDEEIEARALLDEADRRMTVFDFEISPEHSYYSKLEYEFTVRYFNIDAASATAEADRELLAKEMEPYIRDIRAQEISNELANKIDKWYEYSFNEGTVNFVEMISLLKEYVKYLAQQPIAARNTRNRRQTIGLGALALPYQVASLVETGDIAGVQFVTDKLIEFEIQYGISARQMITGDFTGMSMTQRNQLTQDMEILGIDNVTLFVIKKLEGMLGGKYVVVPTHKQTPFSSEDVFNVMSFDTMYADVRDTFTKIKNEIIEWYQQIRNNINRMSESKAEAEIEHASEIFSEIVDRYSDLSEYMPADARTFAKDWFRVELSAGKAKDVIKWLIAQEKRINTILDSVAEVIKYDGYDNTSLQDFAIVKSIPADTLIRQDILDEGVETRNLIFNSVCESSALRPQNKIIYIRAHRDEFVENVTANISSADVNLINEFLDVTIEKLERLQLRFDYGEQIDYYQIREEISSSLVPDDNGNIIDIFTGELVAKNNAATFETEVFDKDKFKLMNMLYDFVTPETATLSDFINIDKFPTEIREKLEKVTVSQAILPPNLQGFAARNQITINVMASDQFGTLVHEFNHILQDIYDLPLGFNNETAVLMPDFLHYVTKHYPIYVRDVFINTGHPRYAKRYTQNNLTEQDINEAPRIVKELLSFCAYSLVQGELWARAYTHNGKPVHGFAEILTSPNTSYLLSPDGKIRFKIPNQTAKSSTSASPKLTEVLAGSALDVAIQKLFALKKQQELEGYNTVTARNTYHSHYTRGSSTMMTQRIMNPATPLLARYTIKLTDIIKNPQDYLAPEILAKCNGDFSEGNVFYRVKEYIEANFEGVSIDRKDSLQEEYVYVDDNAFDDLLLSSVKNKIDKDETSIVSQYKENEHIPLSKFYSQQELNRLGINPSAYVVIKRGNGTETVFDYAHSTGAIVMDVNENTTDSSFINDLNHEFRHLLQYYNGFATGFTPDFKVSQEMLADVKKHLPELFKNQEIVKWAKEKAKHTGVKNYEELIVQRMVYYATSGELNAYAFNAQDLYAKPVYVNTEAGNPTIFMPWYDAKTGEGRYKTEFLAMRADKGLVLPKVEKKKKDTRPRAVPKYKMKDTNLKYYDKGTRVQLDPTIQDFVVATTGNEDKLPPELWHAIREGKLTLQSFYKWFRKVDASQVNDFTFKLINKHIFKNEHINSMSELDSLLTFDPAFYWAAALVLRKNHLGIENIIAENDINKFIEFLKSLDGTKWYDKILETTEKFSLFETGLDEDGEPIYENIAVDTDTLRMMRVLAMEYFNGTLAGAFYTGNAFKKAILKRELERREKLKSADASMGDGMSDDKDVSYIDTVTEEDAVLDTDSRAVGNDIVALYELNVDDAERFIEQIVHAKYLYDVNNIVDELGLPDKAAAILKQRLFDLDKLRDEFSKLRKKENRTEQEEKRLKNYNFALNKYKGISAQLSEFKAKLESLDISEVIARGTDLVIAQTIGTTVNPEIFNLAKEYTKTLSTEAQDEMYEGNLKTDRVNVQTRIKNSGKTISKFLREKVITFEQLPQEVGDMFEQIVVDNNGKKMIEYKLMQSVYSVGKGRKTLEGPTDTGRAFYVPKHNITEGNEAYRHDTDEILKVDKLLRATVKEIRKMVKSDKEITKTAEKRTQNLERENTRLKAKNIELSAKNKALKTENKGLKTTEIRVNKKQSRTSDTPNIFNIISGIDMPYQLRKIFDVSFEAMASTKVQFASRDEKTGELYNKETFSEKEFNGRVKHEVANWDAFYEVNRDTLMTLSRNDILEILNFLKSGMSTIDGPSGKLAAFEIFILGYIVDGARRNFNNWNFSDNEIAAIEELYEKKASQHGSGLNAVKQMLKVVDPMKKIRQRMFNDWDTISDDDKDHLIEMVDALQAEKNVEAQKEQTENIIATLKEFGERQTAAEEAKYPRWSKAWWRHMFSWQKIKSFRYLAMLSGPTTWIRNKVSDVILLAFNKASDVLGNLVFLNKGYRKNQWNLHNTKISTEAKNFIDTYIRKNKLFNDFYDVSTKYDPRQNKKLMDERGLLVTLIAQAYEKKYAQDHRFDTGVMKIIAKGVDFMISDREFIKFAAARYFGKMLTIEAANGNIDLSQGLSAKAMDLFAESIILASQEYMHKRSFMADWMDDLKKKGKAGAAAHELLTFWQPFINSSFNWYVEMLKYTPLGLANSIIRMCKLEKQITSLEDRRAKGEMVVDSRVTEYLAKRDIGKGILGLVLSGLGVWLALSGRLRIEDDDDKFYLYADGDVKFDITPLFGSSSVLIGASVAQLWVEQTDGDTAGFEDMMSMVTNTMLDGFFAFDILDRHRWGGHWDDILTETESVARSFVPQVWQTIIACTNNKKIRYSPGLAGMWERWLNSFVPGQPMGNRKVNPYTGELEDKYSLPIIGALLEKGLLLGPKIYWVEVSEIERMCRELKVNKGELTGELTVNGKKIELDRLALNKKYGELNKESLLKIKSQRHSVEMPDGTFQTLPWDKMNDKQRANVLSRTFTKNADYAKIYVWTQVMGKKYYASASSWQTLRLLGITQNVYKGDKGFVE